MIIYSLCVHKYKTFFDKKNKNKKNTKNNSNLQTMKQVTILSVEIWVNTVHLMKLFQMFSSLIFFLF